MMKNKLLLCLSLALASTSVNAQTVKESKLLDNWFLGINGGAYIKTTHSNKFDDTRALLGIQTGRYITPIFGLRADAKFYLNDASGFKSNTVFSMTNVSLDGLFNFNNLFSKYKGEPRTFEFVGVTGIGWLHGFGDYDNYNKTTAKLGLQCNYNFGSKKEWQINLEPDIFYLFNKEYAFNVNKSAIQISAGVTYKFKCSNKTHNFIIANNYSQSDIDALNATINSQRNDLSSKDAALSDKDREIANLKKQLSDCEDYKNSTPEEVKSANLSNVVIFNQGSSSISNQQEVNISMIANYLKNNPKSKVSIKGYASPEGGKEFNQKLSLKRANAVKNALVNKYGIDANRLSVNGLGASDKVFQNDKWNRVCIFVED